MHALARLAAFAVVASSALVPSAARADTQFYAAPFSHKGISVNVKSIHLGWDGKLWVKLKVHNGTGGVLTMDRNQILAAFADGRAKSREVSVWTGPGKPYVVKPAEEHDLHVEYMMGKVPMRATLKMNGFAVNGAPVAMPDLVCDVQLPKLIVVKDDKIELKQKVQFATDRADILPASHPLLDEVADALRSRPDMRVRVEGHTDARGSLDHNQQLSQLRAEAVRAFLAGKGIDRGRMDAQGFGPSRPIADERTPEGQDRNRRVEFVILSK